MKTRKMNLTSKSKWTSLALVAAVGAGLLALPVSVLAVGGQCSNCHTMHNSQDGSPMNYDGSAVPNQTLLRGDCIGCHTGTNDGASTHAPFVYDTTEPSYGAESTVGSTLAGGNFYWVLTDDNKGHNVFDSNLDDDLGNVPPGGDASLIAGNSHVTCAGTTGCHGERTASGDMAGIAGGHHGNATGVIDGGPTTVGGSYRFLKGVEGYEDPDYQWSFSGADHNEYKGVDRANDDTIDGTTISSLCAQCHPDFHNTSRGGNAGIDLGSVWGGPWVRHPTDYDMNETPGTSEYQSYVWDEEAPVGRATIAAASATVLQGSASDDAIVLCVSCHRAHGSPNADLLRWSYGTMVAGNGSTGNVGCFRCHTTKDD